MNDELDILREVGSIASGHGSTALSDILKRKVYLSFPSIDIITTQEMPTRMQIDQIVIAAFCRILDGLEGEVAIILTRENAMKLINLSYKADPREPFNPGFITECSLSAVKEICNIIIASYLNSLSVMFRRVIIPPTPTLVSSSVEDIFNVILSAHKDVDYCYLVEAVFEEKHSDLHGEFSLIITPYAAKNIREMCRKMLSNGGHDPEEDILE